MMELLMGLFLQEYIIPIFGAIFLFIANSLVRKLGKKLKAEENGFSLETLFKLSELAALYAEEKAAKLIKIGKSVDGSEKLEMASDWLLTKDKNVDKEDAKRLIEAVLSKLGLGATKN